MGLVLTNNVVVVDHRTNEHMITGVAGNPKDSVTACGLHVSSIFTRLKASAKYRRERARIGDNCPMLYALKQNEGLVTTHGSVRHLVESARLILAGIAEGLQADTVLYMPSQFPLSRMTAKRCASALRARVVDDAFRKATLVEAYEMLASAPAARGLSAPDKRRLRFRLGRSDSFSLKNIPVSHRYLFQPLFLRQRVAQQIKGRVVLVDDLLATGQTLSVAARLVRELPSVESVRAICLFSDL